MVVHKTEEIYVAFDKRALMMWLSLLVVLICSILLFGFRDAAIFFFPVIAIFGYRRYRQVRIARLVTQIEFLRKKKGEKAVFGAKDAELDEELEALEKELLKKYHRAVP